jgi:hypothetical protein
MDDPELPLKHRRRTPGHLSLAEALGQYAAAMKGDALAIQACIQGAKPRPQGLEHGGGSVEPLLQKRLIDRRTQAGA